MSEIFGKENTNSLRKADTEKLPVRMDPKNLTESDFPFESSRRKICVLSQTSFSVSSCGQRIWGVYKVETTERTISKILMYDFKSKSSFLYDYEHQYLVQSVMVSETNSLALSGGIGRYLVLHGLASGQTLKTFDTRNARKKKNF